MSLIKIPQSSLDFFKKNQDEIFNSGNLAEGPWNKKLSEKIKEISGSKNAVCVNSNGSGLVAILLIFKTYFGREEIMIQSNTMYGVKTIVGTAGYNLVNYINCQIETLMPSFQDVKNAIKKLPSEYKKLIGFNRVVPVLDEYGTPVRFVGQKFGGSGKTNPALKLEKLTPEQERSLRKQVKTDAKALEKGRLKDKILSTTGKVLKGVGKVIKPIGYAVGTKALFDAQAIAKERGIELSNFDKLLAVDSGDPNVAINNYMRRNDPEFAAAERAKDLAKMTDDFEEVGQTTFGKFNDQIKNIKLP